MCGLLDKRYVILAQLYMVRTIPVVFFVMALPVILRLEGFSLEVVALLQLAGVPYLLKFLWAPLLDRGSGGRNHYKRWVLWTGFGYGMVFLLLGFLNLASDFETVVTLLLAVSFLTSTQDIAISALYTRLLSFEERGAGSSTRVLGLNLGGILGSGLFLLVYSHFGWQACMSGIGVLALCSLVPLPMLAEEGLPGQEGARAVLWTAFASFFKTRGMVLWFAFLVLNSISTGAVFFMVKPFLVDRGVDTDTIAWLVGFYGMLMAAFAAMATGGKWFQNYLLRRRRAYIYSVLLQAVALALFVPLALSDHAPVLLYVAVAVLNIAVTVGTVVSVTLVMDFSRSGSESIDYSLQLTGIHLGGAGMTVFSGMLVAYIGYPAFFFLQAALGAFMVLVTAVFFRGDWVLADAGVLDSAPDLLQ